jgi:hypothetical protein
MVISGSLGSINEVQEFAMQWMYQYYHQHPNMALGGITPKQRLFMVAQLALILRAAPMG